MGRGAVEAVVRALDTEAKALMLAIVRATSGIPHHGTVADLPALRRLHERGCVRVMPYDRSRDMVVPTKLGELAARLP